MRILILLGLLLIAAPAVAQTPEQWRAEDRIFHAGLGAFAVATAWDAWNTVACVESMLCREANPVYRRIVERRGIKAAMAVKLAGSAAIGGVLLWQRPKHRRVTALALATVTGLQLWVNAKNYRTLQRVGLR